MGGPVSSNMVDTVIYCSNGPAQSMQHLCVCVCVMAYSPFMIYSDVIVIVQQDLCVCVCNYIYTPFSFLLQFFKQPTDRQISIKLGYILFIHKVCLHNLLLFRNIVNHIFISGIGFL